MIFLLGLAGCGGRPTAQATSLPATAAAGLTPGLPTAAAGPTATLAPTATSAPLVARVNGEGLSLADYQAELARYQEANGPNLATGWEKTVLEALVDELLLAQGARQTGYVLSEADLQARLDRLAAELGGPAALAEWQMAYGYSAESFRAALRRAAEAAWMRDQIAASIPPTADQAHVRQILLYNSDEANQVLAQLQAGADFAQLAATYDPQTAGDLGWFPQGYLTEPALEAVIFALQPGQYSGVVTTRLGYHIVKLIERDPQRPLTPDARLTLQTRALQNWLAERRQQSAIERLIP
jgi:parvulin-like peptidyl-prolyl isomerase